jgi:hypothetical protein
MRMYLDADAKFPAGQPIVVTAADETAAMIKAMEVAEASGIAWKAIAKEPAGSPDGGRRRQPRRR